MQSSLLGALGALSSEACREKLFTVYNLAQGKGRVLSGGNVLYVAPVIIIIIKRHFIPSDL